MVVVTAIGVAWIPLMSDAQGGQVFQYATSVAGYLGAPTCAMFILAMFWKRCNEQASKASFVSIKVQRQSS